MESKYTKAFLLNWLPKTNIDDGLKKTINWYKSHYIDKTPEEENAHL